MPHVKLEDEVKPSIDLQSLWVFEANIVVIIDSMIKLSVIKLNLPFQKRFLWVCWKRSLYVACMRRGKIVYIEISPHPAYAGIIWELLLLL